MFRKFENIPLIVIDAGNFRRGAAVTIPGLGIISGKKGIQQKKLLRHEFGHILQFRKWGFFFYWFRIAPASLSSARKANSIRNYNHMNCWTEWSANQLSYLYFNRPSDWDFKNYPVKPPVEDVSALPAYLRNRIITSIV